MSSISRNLFLFIPVLLVAFVAVVGFVTLFSFYNVNNHVGLALGGGCYGTAAKYESLSYHSPPVLSRKQPPAGSCARRDQCLLGSGAKKDVGTVMGGVWLCAKANFGSSRYNDGRVVGAWHLCERTRAQNHEKLAGYECKLVSGHGYEWVKMVSLSLCGGHGQVQCVSGSPCKPGLQACSGVAAGVASGKCYYCCADVTGTCGDPPGPRSCQSSNPNAPYYDSDCSSPVQIQYLVKNIRAAIIKSNKFYDHYDDSGFINLLLNYDYGGKWGEQWLSDFAVYSCVRTAIKHESSLSSKTRELLNQILKEAANKPIHLNCGGLGNSCSEDYIGHAVMLSSYNGWFRTHEKESQMMNDIITAFKIESPVENSHHKYSLVKKDGKVRLYNHGSESPVYAAILFLHFENIQNIYKIRGLGTISFPTPVKENAKQLYAWINSKTDGSLFKKAACYTPSNSYACDCNDKPSSSSSCNHGGKLREPSSLPIAQILRELGVSNSEFPSYCITLPEGQYNIKFYCEWV